MNVRSFTIGFDDTDSPRGLCTTFVVTEVMKEFSDFEVIGYPRLVRLNPNIPWKTRGNGAVAVSFGAGRGTRFIVGTDGERKIFAYPRSGGIRAIDIDDILERADAAVLRNSALSEKRTNPAIVVSATALPEILYRNAVSELVAPSDVVRTLKRIASPLRWRTHRGTRGIVGASAAIAWRGRTRTFELVAYRERSRWGTRRNVDFSSVLEMDRNFHSTFNNIDVPNRHVVISPHSPCPVLFGIRAFEAGILFNAGRMIVHDEKLFRSVLFSTNQGTDDHLRKMTIAQIRPYVSAIVKARVIVPPETGRGGHVFFRISDGTGSVDCAAYEPTKEFRNFVRALVVGDVVHAIGGVHKRPFTINLEKLRLVTPARLFVRKKPLCSHCGVMMKSMGRSGIFRCRKCHRRAGKEQAREEELARHLRRGLYEVPKCARRHLSRPLQR